MNTTRELPNPSDLSLDELRLLRQQMQLEDDAVSYARRVAQARLDIVKAEAEHRTADGEIEVSAELRTVLSHHLTGGPARPPRPTEDVAADRRADQSASRVSTSASPSR